jgi:hypothetical protein
MDPSYYLDVDAAVKELEHLMRVHQQKAVYFSKTHENKANIE